MAHNMQFPTHDGKLSTLWSQMDANKGDLVDRSEQYGMWTIPSITMDVSTQSDKEAEKGHVVVGARLVNHLANRVADTMFPHHRAFVLLKLTPESQLALEKETGPDRAAELADIVRTSTARVEEVAMRKLNMTAYRPMAVMAIKHLIISGNAMIKRLLNGTRIVYGVRDFCIRRDLDGSMREAILRDNKKFGNLSDAVQAELRASGLRDYQDDTDVVLYSHYKLIGKRWQFQQAADNVMLAEPRWYSKVDMPLLPLTWSLARGEDYGRGLVEDNAIAFHNLDVLTAAMIDLMAAIADIKFLVRTGSTLDVVMLNQAERGTYHQGNEGDITVPEIGKRGDLQVMMSAIEKWERDLSQSFLLNSASTRDAERVTAEEIRLNARELESGFGGLYSKLALEWQQHEGEYAISQVDISKTLGANANLFEVIVVTGLESLSREGQLDALRLAIADMQMLDTVPDELRSTINPLMFASFVFTNRGVKLEQFLYTEEQMAANKKAAMAEQQALMQAQAGANVAEHGGKASVDADQPQQ